MTANADHTEKLMTDLKRVVQDSEDLLHDSAGVMGEKARVLRERLANTLEKAKESCQVLQQKAKETAKATDKAIRAHPYQSLAIALGAGIALGFLVGRKHHKS